jgi:hypothetical protein
MSMYFISEEIFRKYNKLRLTTKKINSFSTAFDCLMFIYTFKL